MTRNSFMVLIVLVLGFAVLVTEGRSKQQTRAVGQKLYFVDENDEPSADDKEEFRFLTGGGTGGSSSVAINNLITQKQQLLESLRPVSGTGIGTSTAAANVIFVNAGAGSGIGSGIGSGVGSGVGTGVGAGVGAGATATGLGGGGTIGAAANPGNGVAAALLPQVIGAAVGGTRGRRRPSNRRRRPNRNRNRNRNRKRSRGQSRNRKQPRPQIYLVRSRS